MKDKELRKHYIRIDIALFRSWKFSGKHEVGWGVRQVRILRKDTVNNEFTVTPSQFKFKMMRTLC